VGASSVAVGVGAFAGGFGGKSRKIGALGRTSSGGFFYNLVWRCKYHGADE